MASKQPNTCRASFAGAIAMTLLLAACLMADDSADSLDRVRVAHDSERFETTVTIQAIDGRIRWTDLLRGLSRARGYDDSALNGLFPEKSIPITGTRGRLSITALNLALSPHLECELANGEKAGDAPSLVVKLDREAILASHRRIKSLLRENIAQRLPSRHTYGVTCDQGWQEKPIEKPLVIFVHGFQASGAQSTAVLKAPRQSGYPCGAFNYPNDQPLADSAALLSQELQKLAKQQPERRVCLVAHSMGGLIARAVVEDPQLDLGNVKQLVQFGTPNQGSLLAYFAYGLDVTELAVSEIRRPSVSAIFASVEDGLADAQRDLRPDSQFLTRLNARNRNPSVRYTVVLGDHGPLTDQELAKARDTLQSAGDHNRWIQFFGSRMESWVADLDEVVKGRGDGAVAMKRGKLTGVDDTVIVHASHLDFILESADESIRRELDQILLDRLK